MWIDTLDLQQQIDSGLEMKLQMQVIYLDCVCIDIVRYWKKYICMLK